MLTYFKIIGGDITISGDVAFNSGSFTLTCISTGGPATTITWTRDSTTVTEGTETVLNDPVTAQYTHTLTVNAWGAYTCNVTNNKPSTATASIELGNTFRFCYSLTVLQFSGPPPPTNVAAEQDGPTSIRVTWTPPSLLLNGITGYRISYTQGSSSSSSNMVDVENGNIDSHTLTGLTNGQTYTISIATTSMGIFGDSVQVGSTSLGKY